MNSYDFFLLIFFLFYLHARRFFVGWVPTCVLFLNYCIVTIASNMGLVITGEFTLEMDLIIKFVIGHPNALL